MSEEEIKELQFKKVDTAEDIEKSSRVSKMIEEIKRRKSDKFQIAVETLETENLLSMDQKEFVDLMFTYPEYVKIMLLRDISLSLQKGLQIGVYQEKS